MTKKSSKIKSDPGELVKPDPAEEKLDRSEELISKESVRETLLEI